MNIHKLILEAGALLSALLLCTSGWLLDNPPAEALPDLVLYVAILLGALNFLVCSRALVRLHRDGSQKKELTCVR